jgi:hypothetical protein
MCGEEFKTACIKRDHQRRCNPWPKQLKYFREMVSFFLMPTIFFDSIYFNESILNFYAFFACFRSKRTAPQLGTKILLLQMIRESDNDPECKKKRSETACGGRVGSRTT